MKKIIIPATDINTILKLAEEFILYEKGKIVETSWNFMRFKLPPIWEPRWEEYDYQPINWYTLRGEGIISVSQRDRDVNCIIKGKHSFLITLFQLSLMTVIIPSVIYIILILDENNGLSGKYGWFAFIITLIVYFIISFIISFIAVLYSSFFKFARLYVAVGK